MTCIVNSSAFRIVAIVCIAVASNACAAPSYQAQRSNAAAVSEPTPDAALAPMSAAMERSVADADALIKKGKKRVAKGEKRLAKARDQISKGEELIAVGKDNLRQSRDRYDALARAAGSATNPDQVFDEAKRFKKVANAWEDALEDVEDGNERINNGNDAVAKARSEIRDGESYIESGQSVKRRLELEWAKLPEPGIQRNHPREQDR